MDGDVIYRFFYNGFWRIDWGFGNPNKTAVLILQLAFISLGLIGSRKWIKLIGILTFTIMSICLFHTFSRGALLAYVLNLSFIAVFLRKRINLKTWIFIFLLLICFVSYISYIGLVKRCTASDDKSVSNRLEIWSYVPQMISDAPYGWGIGNSGYAYMKYYQPENRSEEYRTLVNSHFTWLVEFGWLKRIAYISAWLIVLYVSFPRKRRLSATIPFVIISSFFICGFFSSIAEETILWMIPAWYVALSFYQRYKFRKLVVVPFLFIVSLVSVLYFASILTWKYSFGYSSIIRLKNDDCVYIGNSNKVNLIIIPDETVLGKRAYIKNLKSYVKKSGNTIAICTNEKNIICSSAAAPIILVFGGKNINFSKLSSLSSNIHIICPDFPPSMITLDTLKNIQYVYIGELSNDQISCEWNTRKRIIQIESVDKFIPDIVYFIETMPIFRK